MQERKRTVETNTYDALSLKPVRHIECLIQYISPHANILETNSRHLVNFVSNNSRQCCLLLRGTASLFRSHDGFMLNSESAPYIFGLSNQFSNSDYLFMRTETTCQVAFISVDKANQIIAQENLWESLAKILIYTAGRVYEHCTRLVSPTSYDIIRTQLYELMREADELRLHTTAANYIQSRSFLSRSSIMKILADLKKGGYIITERGVLQEIQKNIPLKY